VLPEQAKHLARLGVPAERLFGKDHRSIHRYLKDPAVAPVHPDVRVGEFATELGGQTGRPGLVVSDHAERDVDPHQAGVPDVGGATNHNGVAGSDQRDRAMIMLRSMRRHGLLLLCCSALLSPRPALAVQNPAGQLGMGDLAVPVAAPAPADTALPPYAVRRLAVLPGALLPATRIVAFYGNPLSTRMGILGALPPAAMMAKLETTAAEWAAADSTRPVRPALHLIATVAQGQPGRDSKYRLRDSDSLIDEVAEWAQERGWLLFLDVQVGQSTVPDELSHLVPWLRKPWVHLALDPEFAMTSGRVPGRFIGTLNASQVNYAIRYLAELVTEYHLPPKVLVVHRFTDRMLTGYRDIVTDPRVQVVIDMDGFGPPALKKHIYDVVVTHNPVQFAGIKLFYKNDKPMLSFAEILALRPVPLYIQYQ